MHIIRNLFTITIATLVLVFSWSFPVFSAGTVTVTKSADLEKIKIIGDDLNNVIDIVTDPISGHLLLTGFSTGVTGLGLPSPIDIAGVTQIIVKMNGGNDWVDMGGSGPDEAVNTPGIDWIVKGNEGEDNVTITDVMACSLTVKGGRDNDVIIVDEGLVMVDELSGADGGSGDDTLVLIDHDIDNKLITGPFDITRFEFIEATCFRGDTLVATENGLRPIRTIRVGDRVWSWDKSSDKKVLRKVSRTMRKPAYGLRTLRVGQETIYTTDTHPYWVEGKGWVKARYLRTGDSLRGDDGARLVVLNNDRVDSQSFFAGYDVTQDHEPLASTEQKGGLRLASYQPSKTLKENNRIDGVVYNIEVKYTHTFFVGKQKVLVHNK